MSSIRYNSSPLILCVLCTLLTALVYLYFHTPGRSGGALSTFLRQDDTPLSVSKEQLMIEELERIKLSVRNEVRLLEKERFELASDITSKKSQLTKLSQKLKYTQKKLNAERDSFLQLSNKQRQISLHEWKWNKPNSGKAEPIYILSGASEYEGQPVGGEGALDRPTECGSNGCFDMNACSVLHEPGIYLIQDGQSDSFASQLLDSFSLNSAHQVLENADSACFHVSVSLSPDTAHLLSELQTLDIWHNSTQPILLVQLLPPHSAESQPPAAQALPDRVLLASPLAAVRPKHDIVIPPLLSRDDALDTWSELPLLLPLHRKYLIYFAGSFEGDTTPPFLPQLEQFSSNLPDKVSIHLNCSLSHPLNNSWGLCEDRETRVKLSRESLFSFIPAAPGQRGVGAAGLVRLSEALSSGSIPVVCAEEMGLPYSEVVQWDKAVLRVSPHRIHELHYLIRRVSDDQLLAYKQQGRFLWINYFSSAFQILLTAVTLLLSRLSLPPPSSPSYTPDLIFPTDSSVHTPHEVPWTWYPAAAQQTSQWNTAPGSHLSIKPTPWQRILTNSMQYLKGTPPSLIPLPPHVAAGSGVTGVNFQNFLLGNSPPELFTILILTYKRRQLLLESLTSLLGVRFLHKVVVVWNDPYELDDLVIPELHVPVLVVRGNGNSLNNRFLPYEQIETEAVLSLDDDIRLEHDEIDLAFRVWRENRDRLVGFPGRFHLWDVHSNQWLYNTNLTCEISMVLTGAVFLHSYYLYLYSNWLPASIRRVVDEFMNCEDIAMNFLVAHISRQPPIKVTPRTQFSCDKCSSLWARPDHFKERSQCINMFVDEFGYMPLLYTQFRADSMLYRTQLPPQCYRDV